MTINYLYAALFSRIFEPVRARYLRTRRNFCYSRTQEAENRQGTTEWTLRRKWEHRYVSPTVSVVTRSLPEEGSSSSHTKIRRRQISVYTAHDSLDNRNLSHPFELLTGHHWARD